MKVASAERVFPHPSFVYTAKYHPIADWLVVTGCYDSVIRIWNANVKEIHGQLLQELDGHKGFVNTLCFDAEGTYLVLLFEIVFCSVEDQLECFYFALFRGGNVKTLLQNGIVLAVCAVNTLV